MKGKLIITLVFLTFAAKAQEVTWTYSAQKLDRFTYEVHLTANIARSWHIYSQHLGAEGPVPTTIKFGENPASVEIDSIKEIGNKIVNFEPAFNMDVSYYETKVDFLQRFQLKTDTSTVIAGTIEYMACTESHCLPPQILSFNIILK